MGTLDQVTRMKGQGIDDREIFNELSQQGISPREINDALRQAQIKYAVSNAGGDEELQPSIMPEGEMPPSPEGNQEVYAPMPQEQYQQQEQYQPQYQSYEQQPQENYQPGGYEQSSQGMDTDTIMEIADQVFSEKIKKTQKQVDTVAEVSTLLQTKVENISERLKKIETIIDKLQIAILEKVGSYGKNLEGIKKEMSMMQDSFSKMISPSRRIERREEYSAPEETSEENETEEETEEAEKPKRKISKKR